MLLHTAPGMTAPQSRPFRMQDCPQCGDLLLAPLMAEHVNARHVRNHWVCEGCGHTFRESFKFAAEDALAG
jgi:ribosomal protein S27AE